ncbi:hypothetical protein MNV49_005473 [Pseudohyphozyma bogoriensis]|nr:hypothetical protein MNV49_005473 [Pseudohyphozyma bogoriensis]
MARKLKVAALQVGAVHRTAKREDTLARIIKLVEEAAALGVKVAVLPELALTTFFARIVGLDDDPAHPEKLDDWYEKGDIRTSKNVKPLFDRAAELGVDICLGYGELTEKGEHFNTCAYVQGDKELAKYRKVHLPGTVEPFPNPDAVNQLEKRYFIPGTLGFKAFRAPNLTPGSDPIMGMMICNDRRWAESWRCYGLQGVELVMCGYNTANWGPDLFGHAENTNATFSISAARAGYDDDKYGMIGSSTIIHPEGHIIAISKTLDDEVVYAEIDLDDCLAPKEKIFNFGKHRRVEHYGIITEQTGVVVPPVAA